jgi:hypothetical protein
MARTGRVGCVVSYCDLERHFLRHTVRESAKFAHHVVVVSCDALFDGTPQDSDELQSIKSEFSHADDVTFVTVHIDPVDELIDAPELTRRTAYWHNRMRWEGVRVLRPECDYVMFLDADEVPEGDRVATWLRTLPAPTPESPAIKCANYWYLREPTLRSRHMEDSVALVPRHRVRDRDAVMLCNQERNDLAHEPVLRSVTDGRSAPMFHHFSWVRTPEDLVRKVRLWGHKDDRDWETAVRAELRRPIVPGHHDLIFGRGYDIVPSPFGIPPMAAADG